MYAMYMYFCVCVCGLHFAVLFLLLLPDKVPRIVSHCSRRSDCKLKLSSEVKAPTLNGTQCMHTYVHANCTHTCMYIYIYVCTYNGLLTLIAIPDASLLIFRCSPCK